MGDHGEASASQSTSKTTSTAAAADNSGPIDIYEQKDEAYFGYYSMLSHQAQMLQDGVRTAAYQRAIIDNAQDFQDKVVMDVGAGNGILSFFAAQAGASKVYAVEASNMVDCLRHVVDASSRKTDSSSSPSDAKVQHLVQQEQEILEMMGASSSNGAIPAAALFGTTDPTQPRNAWLQGRLVPVHSKVEDVTPAHLEGHGQVDTIVSECLGVLLVHERMCESFLDARDRFLAPGGSVFPSAGTICLSPFEDKQLHGDTVNKARWWLNNNFYGVDLSPFASLAFQETCSSPVVGVFGPQCLLSVSSDYVIDFAKISKQQLQDFTMPVEWTFSQPAIVHGLGGWFDLHFNSHSSSTSNANSNSTSTSNADALASLNQLIASASAAGGGDATMNGLPTIDPAGATAKSNFMTTSPYAEPTHWQQVRFLLPEPLAVNRGQKLNGQIRCIVNDQRSYTMHADFTLFNADGSTNASLARKAVWRLDRQTYSWS
ncbi:S-adenosyl-L-methionine-dependent methyltransferase [Testicularia cyperi]|uniref:type I protein arginine methyltransferase n=1 Tax=Testicularia cyperi TaxID=1882483 RepID=A0A317XRJ9_9BASI|nr:S-adenosyl-L-methionine-dependent methyltransferase [Testicularia cyperi]